MRKTVITFLIISMGFALHGAGVKEENQEAALLEVFVSIPPQEFFVQAIGGNLVQVSSMVKQNDDPHTFQPRPNQITALGKADIYFSVGIAFEKAFLTTIADTLPELRIVDSSAGVRLIAIEEHDEEEHHDDGEYEEEEDDHDHGEYDPHFWLGPEQVLQSAEVIFQELLKALPEHGEQLRSNYGNFIGEVQKLDETIASLLKEHRGEIFFVFHPSFGYFADAYGLRQVAIETGGKEPSPRQLEHIIEEAREKGVKTIFVQPQFSQSTARLIAQAIEGNVVPISPMSRGWLSNMETIAVSLKGGLD